MKVIFMGTSDFGSEVLNSLIADNTIELVAIYSKEPSISGRGKKINRSPIHEIALKHNIKTITPKNFKETAAIDEFINLKADLAIVVSYGLILPKEILGGTKYGCINIHPSILPKWRGAAPLQRTIMNGDTESAMTIIQMNEKLDAGDIIHQKKITLADDEDFISLSHKMSTLAVKLTKKTIEDVIKDKIQTKSQEHEKASYANKISKDESQIDWNKPAHEIIQKIRGLNGNLGAYFLYNGEKFKILQAQIINNSNDNSQTGEIIDGGFTIKCQDYAIIPLIIQRSGKNPSKIKDFLLGFKPEIGKIIEYNKN